jgi:hypothetical protein
VQFSESKCWISSGWMPQELGWPNDCTGKAESLYLQATKQVSVNIHIFIVRKNSVVLFCVVLCFCRTRRIRLRSRISLRSIQPLLRKVNLASFCCDIVYSCLAKSLILD